jgi:type I restriction enzyme S subunit
MHLRKDLLKSDNSSAQRVKLGNLVSVVSTFNKIPKEQYLGSGSIPIIDQSQKFISGYSDDSSNLTNDSVPCVVFGDHTRAIKYVDFPFLPGADGVKIIIPTEPSYLNIKFLFHAMTILDIPNLGYSRHWSVAKEMTIWVPDMPEQLRIAEILDRVQSLSEDVSQGLPAEITARRQQYEYYRNELLTFKELKAS